MVFELLKTIFFDIFVVNALILQISKAFFVFYFYHQVWDYILNMRSSSNSPMMSNVRDTSISTPKFTSCLCVNSSLDFSFFKYIWWTHMKVLESNWELTHKYGAGKDVSQLSSIMSSDTYTLSSAWCLKFEPHFTIFHCLSNYNIYVCVWEKSSSDNLVLFGLWDSKLRRQCLVLDSNNQQCCLY